MPRRDAFDDWEGSCSRLFSVDLGEGLLVAVPARDRREVRRQLRSSGLLEPSPTYVMLPSYEDE